MLIIRYLLNEWVFNYDRFNYNTTGYAVIFITLFNVG